MIGINRLPDCPHTHTEINAYANALRAQLGKCQCDLEILTKSVIDAMTYETCPAGVWNILNKAMRDIYYDEDEHHE